MVLKCFLDVGWRGLPGEIRKAVVENLDLRLIPNRDIRIPHTGKDLGRVEVVINLCGQEGIQVVEKVKNVGVLAVKRRLRFHFRFLRGGGGRRHAARLLGEPTREAARSRGKIYGDDRGVAIVRVRRN